MVYGIYAINRRDGSLRLRCCGYFVKSIEKIDEAVDLLAQSLGFCVRCYARNTRLGWMNAYIFQFDLLSGRCTWECTRAGHPAAKKEGPEIPRNRSSLRCGCEWKVYARRVHPNLDESEWKIVSAKLDHTNGCSPCAEQQLLAERARGLFGVLLLKHLYVLCVVYPKDFLVQLLRQV